MPSEGSARWFAATIDRLAALGQSAPFPPHLTILGEGLEGWDPAAVARALAEVAPFDVELRAVDDEAARFRCVTLRAAPNALAPLRERLAAIVPHRSLEPYRPHLSVLYGERTAGERRALLSAAGLPTRLPVVAVDAVAAWDTTDEDWTRWRELARWPLRGARHP